MLFVVTGLSAYVKTSHKHERVRVFSDKVWETNGEELGVKG